VSQSLCKKIKNYLNYHFLVLEEIMNNLNLKYQIEMNVKNVKSFNLTEQNTVLSVRNVYQNMIIIVFGLGDV